jgi:hypothetical protein
MSTTLSYGYVKPADGDRGATWFPALANNTQQLNDHNHNGINSAPLAITAVVVTTQAISSGSWSSLGGGNYKQTVTLPGTLTYDAVSMEFRITSSKHIIYPTIEKVSSNSYDIYVNDNTIGVTAIYST